jgi:hypothetical protein
MSRRWRRLTAIPDMENGHGDKSGAVSTGTVDGGIHAAIWNRGQVLSCTVSIALAQRISLSCVRKYARRYLAEAAYRFNRRFRLTDMLPRLTRAMTLCRPCAEPVLRAAGNFHG